MANYALSEEEEGTIRVRGKVGVAQQWVRLPENEEKKIANRTLIGKEKVVGEQKCDCLKYNDLAVFRKQTKVE